ncbi:MAG: Hsp20/alpha crystallin family protein [Deltaproteobacteria bacterium]|nr:Hsp20/alpha crystallin family protein [Deltaproteobacteria bacterium]MBW2661400.1 Hsp20/alpha crystallin family protein [Deltaproteobacteria bacterium]
MLLSNLRRIGETGDVWQEMQRLQHEMDRLFTGENLPFTREYPAVNIWTGEDDIIVTSEIPGIEPGNINISVTGDTLTISGSRPSDAFKEGEICHRRERAYGRFNRSIQLPFKVDADKVEAKYEKGVLKIVLPRAEENKPKKISIKTE